MAKGRKLSDNGGRVRRKRLSNLEVRQQREDNARLSDEQRRARKKPGSMSGRKS